MPVIAVQLGESLAGKLSFDASSIGSSVGSGGASGGILRWRTAAAGFSGPLASDRDII